MKTLKTLAFVSLLTLSLTQTAFAAWWNPFSWLWFKRNTPAVKVEQQVVTEMHATTSDAMADWKTYVNKVDGYELQYPSNWNVEEVKGYGVKILNPALPGKADTDQPSEFFSIIFKETGCWDSDWKIGFGGANYKLVCNLKNPGIYISMSALSEDSKKLQDQILSTFKFKEITLSDLFIKNKGKYPKEIKLFSNDELTVRLKKLLEAEYNNVIKNWQVEMPIETSRDIYRTGGWIAHAGGQYDIYLYIDTKTDNINVLISENGKVRRFNEKAEISIPKNLIIGTSPKNNEFTFQTRHGYLTFKLGSSFVAKDLNGKIWNVAYSEAAFNEVWMENGKELARTGDFNAWLTAHKEISSPNYNGPGVPGVITITGILNEQGILKATEITQHVQ